MGSFILDFQAFFAMIFSSIVEFFGWFSSTVIGEIIIFIIIMYIFLFVVKFIISLKD